MKNKRLFYSDFLFISQKLVLFYSDLLFISENLDFLFYTYFLFISQNLDFLFYTDFLFNSQNIELGSVLFTISILMRFFVSFRLSPNLTVVFTSRISGGGNVLGPVCPSVCVSVCALAAEPLDLLFRV